MVLPKESVTMRTIAEEAGVTLTTVSRILNNKGGKYAEKTKKKIFEIADRLKYRPNALVLGMQTGKTKTAGVMIPASEFFYSQIISGINFLANEVGKTEEINDEMLRDYAKEWEPEVGFYNELLSHFSYRYSLSGVVEEPL
jgi:transcriptional regulator with XRE-family HTH domain